MKNYLKEKKKLAAEGPVDGVDSKDSIAAYVAVAMFQTGTDSRHQWLQKLRLLQLTQEAQSGATDKLIRVLKVLNEMNPPRRSACSTR